MFGVLYFALYLVAHDPAPFRSTRPAGHISDGRNALARRCAA
jgi:hypothetical protein